MPFEGDNPLAIMNERLLNNPKPPREVDPSITPELQEIIYRALERDPVNRYPTAREFVHDLEHQDEVGVADRAEMHDWKVRKTGIGKKILMYIGLALIPVVIFSLLLWVARKA
jgi:serine/threonine-protein kinase